MMDFLGEYHNGDGLEFPAQGAHKKKPPFWTLVKQKTLQTNQLIMDSTNISNENEQLEKEITSLKNDHEDTKRKYNLQLAIATKLSLEKVEDEKLIKEYKEILEKQQIKLDENEKHIIQLQSKIKDEEDKNKYLEEIIETTKSKLSKKKVIPTKHQGCQTTTTQKNDFSTNTDALIELSQVKLEMKDFSTSVDFTTEKTQKKDFSANVDFTTEETQKKDFSANVNFTIEKTQKKDFSANVNFMYPSPPKPLMIDKNEWTDECITISKEPFPIFCSKCRHHVHPAPVDQILKIMSVSPPVPLSLAPSPSKSQTHIQVKIPSIRENEFNATDNQELNNMYKEEQNLPINDNQFSIKKVEEKKSADVTEALLLIKNLTKRMAKVEKSVKSIKNKKDESNQNFCPKNFQIVIKNNKDGSTEIQNKSHKKQLKRLKRKKISSTKDKSSTSNKWVVENTEPIKRLKVLRPKNKTYLKSTSACESKLDYLFESPEVDLNRTNSIPSPHLFDENSSSSKSPSLLNEEDNDDIDINNKSVSHETEVLSPHTSQISLYKYTYPNNIEKAFDQNLETYVQSKEEILTSEYNLISSEENVDKSSQEICEKKEDINENKLSNILPTEKGISKINLTKQTRADYNQVSENNPCFNESANSKELNYLGDKISKDNIEEDQTVDKKSKENRFPDFLSYPIVFGESDVSEEELAVCDSIKNQSFTSIENNLPGQQYNTVPQTVLENEEVKDNSFDNQVSTKELVLASPILQSNTQSNNGTPYDIPSSSGIPVTPESITPVSNKTLQAKVLFMEPNDVKGENNGGTVDNSDDLKFSTCTTLLLKNKNHTEAPTESSSEKNHEISHFLPINKFSITPKIPGLMIEPKTRLRIKGDKIESKLSFSESPNKTISCVGSINSCSQENSNTQHTNIEIDDSQSKSKVELFVIPENVLDVSSLKDKIKNKDQSISNQKHRINENSEIVKEENNTVCDNTHKDLREENTDDDTSLEELDFKNVHQLPIMTIKTSPMAYNFFDDTKETDLHKIEETDLLKVEEADLHKTEETDLHKTEEIDSFKIQSNSSEVDSYDVKKSIPENSTIKSSDNIIESNEIDDNHFTELKENTKESIDESTNEVSKSISASPAIKRKKSLDKNDETIDEKTYKVPAKRGRKKLNDGVNSTKTSSRNSLLAKIRTLKKKSNKSVIPLDVKLEPSVTEIKSEQNVSPIAKSQHGVPIIKSEEIIESPIKVKKPELSEKISSLDKSPPSKSEDSVPDIIPTKKQRIAHKPKSINENLEFNTSEEEKLFKKPRKCKSPKKVLNEADKFSSIMEEYNKTCKERAEYSRLQKEQNVKSIGSVNLTDLIKCDSNDHNSLDTKMETVSHFHSNENEIDKTPESSTENKDNINSVSTSEVSPIRALRSRQVLLEKKVPKDKKSLATQGKRSLNAVPDLIDDTNSCLDHTTVLSVLNESVFSKKLMPRKSIVNHKINEKLVYEQLSILIENNQWTSETNQQIVNTLIDSLSLKNLAMHMVEYLENEVPDEDVDKEHTPPAPLMTRSEQKMLILIMSIDKIHSNFIDLILEGIQYKLFRLGYSPKVQIMTRLVRILVVLNKVRKDREKVRMIICDALYCMRVQALFIIETVLSSWPEVLPQYSTHNDILVKTIVHIIMTSVKFNLDNTPLPRLQKLLTGFYNYPNSNYNDEALAVELLKGLEDNVSLVRPSILLLCKKMEPEWTINRIVKGIKNILIKRKPSPLLYEDLTLLGNILRPFSTDNLTKVSDTIVQLCDILTPHGDGVSDDLQEGIVSCLSSITKYKYDEIALRLISWQSKKELRHDTRNKLISFFKMHNKSWWWSFIKKHFSLPNQN